MAEQPFNLDAYKCVNFTGKLWRVTHRNSQSRWDKSSFQMVAADTSRKFTSEASLKEAVEAHIDWGSRKPSCFLSVFSDEYHARSWASLLNPPVYIHEIETTYLPIGPCLVLDVKLLMADLDIEHRYPDHELLFMYRIHSGDITTSKTLSGEPDPDRPHRKSVPLQWAT